MPGKLKAAWSRLPIIVRAIVGGLIVLEIGSDLTVLPLFGNLKFHPEIPWAFPATCLLPRRLLGLVFGPRPSGQHAGCAADLFAQRTNPGPSMARGPACDRVRHGDADRAQAGRAVPHAYSRAAVSIPLSSYPTATVVGALLAIAVSAAVVEETAFRGYMQKPMEDRYGVVPPILVTGVMFWFVHLDKVTVTHLPGHLAASAVFGLLACFTRSLAPAMVAHAAADLLLQPAYLSRSPQFVWRALSADPVWQGESATLAQKLELICRAAKPVNALSAGAFQTFAVLVLVLFFSLLVTILAFFYLARATRSQQVTGGRTQ